MPVPARLVHRLALSAVLVLLATSCGGDADDAAEPEDGNAQAEEGSTVAEDEVELFDSDVIHAIEISFDEGDYDAMIETFADTGEKEWIEATATIDGTTYERVGLRLKGNSSLMGVGRTEGEAEGGRPAPAGGADADDPASLPWLIRLDEFVDGQEHQEYEDIVIRSNSSETSLNEAVALELLDDALLPSQQAMPTSFVVNGGAAELRLAVENPDDDAWQDAAFDSEGALYKAESTGTWEYRGDDPGSYEEVFDQEGGKDVADLTPLIELLQFIDESDDATFSAELEDHLDVEGFATYLATMELLGNFDDIDGPGNNSYLWYDVDTERFTIVPWDLNLALGSGGGFPGGGGPPEGFEPPADGSIPEGFEPPADGGLPEGGPGDGFGRENPLVERFHAEETFEAIYEYKLRDLRADLFATGDAQEILDRWVDVLTTQAGDLVDPATIEEEAESVASHFDGA